MIDKDGRFFHIDFGWVFGKEPPLKGNLASKVRISQSMLDFMTPEGKNKEGKKSKREELPERYTKDFEKHLVDVYLKLREHRVYLMNLMYLMIHSDMTCLRTAEHKEIMTELNNRFQPSMSDDQAKEHIKKICFESIASSGAEWIEYFHNMNKH